MTLTSNNPQSWIDTIWQSIWDYENTLTLPLDSETSDKIDDIKTAMAWISESLLINQSINCTNAIHYPGEYKGICADCGDQVW